MRYMAFTLISISMLAGLVYGAEQTTPGKAVPDKAAPAKGTTAKATPEQGNVFNRFGHQIGKDAKEGTHKAGQAYKQLGKDIGHGTSKTVKDVGHSMNESSKKSWEQAKKDFK